MKDFEQLYKDRPDKKEVGSSGYSNLKHLWNICHDLNINMVIESGTWKGNSSWLFWNAGCKVTCHDVQFIKLMWSHPDITYIQEDIENYDYMFKRANTLFFFDDHCSQLDRLKWLIKQGARYAVFDDNQPGEVCDTLKNPPSPTLEQLRETGHPIMDKVKDYAVLRLLKNRKDFDTRLTLIEL